jgi:hypothetical protein
MVTSIELRFRGGNSSVAVSDSQGSFLECRLICTVKY